MENQTRLLYEKLCSKMAESYSVGSVEKQFSIDPPRARTLNNAIIEQENFLSRITSESVVDMQGEAILLQVGGMIAKRTDTEKNDRTPKWLGDMSATNWQAHLTEFDVGIKYATLDTWARYKDFFQRYMTMVYQKIALDRLTIGWYGEGAQEESKPRTNTLGQDLNYGWIKRLADKNPDHYMLSGEKEENTILLGKGGDYENLDMMVYDVFSMIPKAHRTGKEVAILGQQLLAYDANKNLSLNVDDPRRKSGVMGMTNSYAGLPVVSPANFPERGIMITDPKNLHHYYQAGRMRRQLEDTPKRNCVIDYISSNEAYTIGDLKAISGIKADHLKFVGEAEGAE